MGELGEKLRKAREAKGLSLEQVEEATKIVRSYLQALEDEEFERLPAPVYVKGFLRNYASYLGLDAQEVLSLYSASAAPAPVTPTMTVLDEPLVPSFHIPWRPLVLALVVVALATAGWWGYQWYSDQGWFSWQWPFARATATPTAVPPTPSPTPLPPTPTVIFSPTPAATPTLTPTLTPTPAGLELSIEIVGQRSWLLVQADDVRVFMGILEPGAKYTWTARERIVLRSGWAGAVQVILNGQALGLLGGPGEVVEKEWTAPGVPTRTPAPTATP